jgi:hypothetical protein
MKLVRRPLQVKIQDAHPAQDAYEGDLEVNTLASGCRKYLGFEIHLSKYRGQGGNDIEHNKKPTWKFE